jgi:hypothetical protein
LPENDAYEKVTLVQVMLACPVCADTTSAAVSPSETKPTTNISRSFFTAFSPFVRDAVAEADARPPARPPVRR